MSFSHSGFPSSKFPPMRIPVWNIRGAGSDDFLRTTRDLIRAHDLVVMVLVETKVNNSRADRIIRRLGFSGYFKLKWILSDLQEEFGFFGVQSQLRWMCLPLLNKPLQLSLNVTRMQTGCSQPAMAARILVSVRNCGNSLPKLRRLITLLG